VTDQASLGDDLVGLLLAAPNGLPCGTLARLVHRRKAVVLEELRRNAAFKQTGRRRGSRWILSLDGAGTISPGTQIVPGVEASPDVISPAADAHRPSQAVRARSPLRADQGQPSEGSKKGGRMPLRRIAAAREVDEIAASLGMPVTVAPDIEAELRRMRQRRR